jgi:hypothetical protein
MSLSSAWRLFVTAKKLFIVSRMSHFLISPTCLSTHPSLTPTELAAFGVGPSYAPAGSDNDEEAANNDDETEDDE